MTSTQYRKALKRLDLTITGAGPVIGITPRQSQRLAAGACPISTSIERLVLLLLQHGIPKEWQKMED